MLISQKKNPMNEVEISQLRIFTLYKHLSQSPAIGVDEEMAPNHSPTLPP